MKALLRISSDITTKAPKTRTRFTRRLVANLRAALEGAGIEARVTRDHVRLYLESEDEAALTVASRIFGVHSVSPCIEEPMDSLEQVVERGRELFADQVQGRTYAVRAKVRGCTSFRSQDVNETLGGALMPYGKVNLSKPDVTAEVEVRGSVARFFTSRIPGVAGIPVGVEGRAVMLLSGGFDSAVAAWLALRRGVALDYVFCSLGGAEHERAVTPIANFLTTQWAAGASSRLFVIPFEGVAEMIISRVSESMRQMVLKHLMYQVAASVARFARAEAIITGEAIGQVSSQTLKNLRALASPANVPVLRPLLGYTKEEIIGRARQIGTHDFSCGVPEYCALVPRRPATGATRGALLKSADAVPFDPWEAAHLAERRDLPAEIREADPEEEVEQVPAGALVLDIRPRAAFEEGHLPGARLFDTHRISEGVEGMDKRATYVVVCRWGLASGWLARRLRQLGFRALSLRGGMSRP